MRGMRRRSTTAGTWRRNATHTTCAQPVWSATLTTHGASCADGPVDDTYRGARSTSSSRMSFGSLTLTISSAGKTCTGSPPVLTMGTLAARSLAVSASR